MKQYFCNIKNILFFFNSLLCFTIYSQSNRIQYLDANKAKALINSNGVLFQNQANGIAGYEIPKNSGACAIFCASMWIGGKDENETLRLAALRYGNGRDFFPGPYGSISQNLECMWYQQDEKEIWKVSKEQIACHIANYEDPYYIIPEDILTWPAHGDVSLGISANLAPFVDLDGDGSYEPLNGEYPFILGDQAVFFIMNDIAGQHTETGGLPLGIEVQVMAYQFKETNSFLDSTTFLKYKIINKGTHSYDSLRVSFWADGDIGNYADDYFGSDPTRNMIYFYNGDSNDQSDGGKIGYGPNPPAVGILSLNNDMNYSTYFTSSSAYPYNDPGPATEYYNFMSGKWANGSDMYYGGLGYAGSSGASSTLSDYMFPGDSDPLNWSTAGTDMTGLFPNGWDETENENPPGDRRGVLTNNSTSLDPGTFRIVDYAILFRRPVISPEGNFYTSVERLQQVADNCQQFYNSTSQIQSNLTTIINDVNSYPSCNTVVVPPNQNEAFGPKIRRLDGYGNGGMSLELTANCEDSIITNGFYPITEYQGAKGPINIEIINPSAYPSGYFRLNFHDYTAPTNGNAADTAKWILSHSLNGIVTTYQGLYNISIDTVQIIPELGLRLNIHQKKYYFPAGSNSNQYKITDMIDAKLEFSDTSQWLTGVKDNDNFVPTNWIRSGDYVDTTSSCVLDYLNAPNYMDELAADPNENFENILDGIIAPHRLVGYQASYMPLAYVGNYSSTFKTNASISFLPSIDIVFTSDTTKWTRCPVIELGRNSANNLGNGLPGRLRQSQSVNKQGNSDGTGTGMGWFPGYAVDLESGARLYMAFGENSYLAGENGADMLWNPTNNLVSNTGEPLMGGQHAIYIFSYKQKTINGFSTGFDFPAYIPSKAEAADSNFLQNKWTEVEANATSLPIKRQLYGSLTWVINPMLNPGHSILESDAKIKLRINKEYKNFIATGVNAGKPSYEWENTLSSAILSSAQTTTLCYGQNLNCQVTVNGGTPPYTATLSDGTNIYTLIGPSPLNFSFSPDSSCIIIIESVEDIAGNICPSNNGFLNITIPQLSDSIYSIGPINFCTGNNTTLVAENTENTSYQWYLNNLPIQGANFNYYTTGENASGSYFLQGTSENCVLNSNIINISTFSNIFSISNELCIGPFLWNDQTYSTSGLYTQTFQTSNGCDSIVNLDLTINNNDFNPSLTANQQIFLTPPFAVQFLNTTSNIGNYNFTWYWGDGTSTSSNNPTVFHQYLNNGLYSITLLATNIATGCVDSTYYSDFIFTTGGQSDLLEISNESMSIYPNPTNSDIIIEITKSLIGEKYIITDFSGRIIKEGVFQNSKQKIELGNFSNGIYIIRIKNQNIQERIIKH